MSIPALIAECIQCFDALCGSITEATQHGHSVLDLQVNNVLDERGRFVTWSRNVAAHQSGRSSLEYRLRDASNLRSTVNRYLRDLEEGLAESSSSLTSAVIWLTTTQSPPQYLTPRSYKMTKVQNQSHRATVTMNWQSSYMVMSREARSRFLAYSVYGRALSRPSIVS